METVRHAVKGDLGTIRSVLLECGLPNDDFRDGDVTFLLAESDGSVIGTIGLESYPPLGLLRSAAVLPAFRDRNVGAHLVDALVREARARSLTELVLLTTTAEKFFAKMGFARIGRETLGGPILSSGQFTGTRCSSAAVMALKLR
ncbi:MAG TPA: GNAT family N-acetyltransferase [Bacteroidota bacterium]|nr:GNAT family N-acetyltransferase [Bacteroidota bacterium]